MKTHDNTLQHRFTRPSPSNSLPGNGRHAHPLLARGVLVEGDELDSSGLPLRDVARLLEEGVEREERVNEDH